MNMMTSTEGMLDIRQSAFVNRLERKTKREGNASQGLPTTAKSLTAGIQSVKQELDAVRREQAKVQQAIYEAAQIQRKLCAPRELVWGEFEIAGESFPVRHLSGDFFKVMELDSALGLTVGDIAGKGLSAGIWQAHLMGLVRRCARRHSDPAAAVAEVNLELCQDSSEPPITALFFARLDPQENELVYCNAGLPAPLLLRHNKTVERLEKGGPMLGALQKAAYDSGSLRMNPGDMLLAYSDGVTECRNSEDEEFEMGRLSAAVNAVGDGSANQVLFSTLGAVLDFADACPPEDDLTLLVVRRREGTMIERSPSRGKDFSTPHRGPTSVVRPKKAERRGNRSNS
jgi:sigma-B regulation protein RsbU (phosphoserine phosphatase)